MTRSPASLIQVRHIRPDDGPPWVALRRALWPEESDDAHAAAVQRYFAESRGLGSLPEAVLVASIPSQSSVIIGFAELSRRAYAEGCDTSPVAFLEGWYVSPEHRGQGVGRALVLAAERWGRELGCREFASDAVADNLLSAAAHRALGFEEVQIIRCFRKALDREV